MAVSCAKCLQVSRSWVVTPEKLACGIAKQITLMRRGKGEEGRGRTDATKY